MVIVVSGRLVLLSLLLYTLYSGSVWPYPVLSLLVAIEHYSETLVYNIYILFTASSRFRQPPTSPSTTIIIRMHIIPWFSPADWPVSHYSWSRPCWRLAAAARLGHPYTTVITFNNVRCLVKMMWIMMFSCSCLWICCVLVECSSLSHHRAFVLTCWEHSALFLLHECLVWVPVSCDDVLYCFGQCWLPYWCG